MAEPLRARRLTDQEAQRLQQIVRQGKHGSVRVRRTMIIMASAPGTLVPAIVRAADLLPYTTALAALSAILDLFAQPATLSRRIRRSVLIPGC